MRLPVVRFLLAVLLLLFADFAPVAAQRVGAWYPIKAADGSIIANHRVPVELESQIGSLAGTMTVGNPKGDVTLVEFYDLNCPYCRAAAADVRALLAADKELRLILVPLPILGRPSVEAGRVELAAMTVLEPAKFYEFHDRLYGGRGVIDGQRALAVAREFGIDLNKLVEKANDTAITKQMVDHVKLADAMALQATPAFVIKGVAVLGHPGRQALADMIAAVRRCEKVYCQ